MLILSKGWILMIFLKVELTGLIDGQIIFPLSSVGKNVLVQGTLQKLEFTKDQAINWKIHLAEEKGEILHRDSVKLDHSDLVEYRIVGKGAEIYTFGCNPAQK